MTPQDIIAYCLSKPRAYEDYPFGDIPVCIRIWAGAKTPIFAQIYLSEKDLKVTLKCSPESALFYRRHYPGAVVRGFFCPPSQQPHWNTVYLNGAVSDDALKAMVDEAYRAALERLPKYIRTDIEKAGLL